MNEKLILTIAMISVLVPMLSVSSKSQIAQTMGIIYIKTDGSIDPSSANITTLDNTTYYFTNNNQGGIVVERSNITIDGSGYTLQGIGNESDHEQGVNLNGGNVTIQNMSIRGFYNGISANTSHNTLLRNKITDNYGYGVLLVESSNNVIESNDITRNDIGITIEGFGSNSSLIGNNVTANGYGIDLDISSNNNLVGNIIAHNGYGIYIAGSANNSIFGNIVTANTYGIVLIDGSFQSSNNTLFENTIQNNVLGIKLYLMAIWFHTVGEHIFHNNFVGNENNTSTSGSYENLWDDGYPYGGNYWSDYNGSDVYSGIYQNESGYDWVGDTPYVIGLNTLPIGQNDTDRYPLMNPYSSETGEIELAYRILLMKSDQLQTSLDANMSDLQGQVNILKTEVDNLTLTLNQTSSSFQGQIDSLGNTITSLQAQINSLNSTLQTSTNNTQKQYNSLNSQLDTTSKIMYLLAAMIAVLIVTAVYVAMRKPK